MKKTLIALAALGMVAGAAQATNVTIYGKLQPSIDVVDTGTVDATDMTWNNSRLGFKGSEDLGNGLKAIFQIESKVKFTESSGMDGFGGRDSWVGLAGDFGSVTFGKHQSAYVKSSAKYDVFADSIGDYNNIMGSIAGYNGKDPVDGTFNGRHGKSVYYKSPSFNGFQVQASYALVERDLDNTQDKDVIALAANYSNGPLMAVAAYSKVDDVTSDDAWKIGVGYKFDMGTKLMAIYEDVDNGDANGDHDNLYLAAAHPVNANLELAASFAMADDTDANNDGAKAWNIGATYKFSKRTSVMGVYSKVNNDAGAQYGFDSGYAATAAGQDVSGFSVRLQHKF